MLVQLLYLKCFDIDFPYIFSCREWLWFVTSQPFTNDLGLGVFSTAHIRCSESKCYLVLLVVLPSNNFGILPVKSIQALVPKSSALLTLGSS